MYNIIPKNGRFYIGNTDKWFGTRAKAEAYLRKTRTSSSGMESRRSGPPAPTYPILGGGIIRSIRPDHTHDRPFVVVEVGPGKVRPFYVSTGTGGGAKAGDWSVFGGMNDPGTWMIKAINFEALAESARTMKTVAFHTKDVKHYRPVVAYLRKIRAERLSPKGPLFVFPDESGPRAHAARALNAYLRSLGAMPKASKWEHEQQFKTFGGAVSR